MPLTLIGRSSSHFTRTVRVVAHELDVPCPLTPLPGLTVRDLAAYGGNPALKIPVLQTLEGAWFGALPICRELARRAASPERIVWPEQLTTRLASNAQELVLSAMSTEVQLIMRGAQDAPDALKPRASLQNTVEWLEANLDHAVAEAGATSFLAITAYCFLTHLGFRQVLTLDPASRLTSFCSAFGQRPSAQATPYRFD